MLEGILIKKRPSTVNQFTGHIFEHIYTETLTMLCLHFRDMNKHIFAYNYFYLKSKVQLL